jgi:hypothetical protein
MVALLHCSGLSAMFIGFVHVFPTSGWLLYRVAFDCLNEAKTVLADYNGGSAAPQFCACIDRSATRINDSVIL